MARRTRPPAIRRRRPASSTTGRITPNVIGPGTCSCRINSTGLVMPRSAASACVCCCRFGHGSPVRRSRRSCHNTIGTGARNSTAPASQMLRASANTGGRDHRGSSEGAFTAAGRASTDGRTVAADLESAAVEATGTSMVACGAAISRSGRASSDAKVAASSRWRTDARACDASRTQSGRRSRSRWPWR